MARLLSLLLKLLMLSTLSYISISYIYFIFLCYINITFFVCFNIFFFGFFFGFILRLAINLWIHDRYPSLSLSFSSVNFCVSTIILFVEPLRRFFISISNCILLSNAPWQIVSANYFSQYRITKIAVLDIYIFSSRCSSFFLFLISI